MKEGLWFLRGEIGRLGVRRRAAAAAEVADRPPQSLTPSIRCLAGFSGSDPVVGTETVSANSGLEAIDLVRGGLGGRVHAGR